jgi:hypothetical protein
VAQGKLVISSLDGAVYCFGEGAGQQPSTATEKSNDGKETV